MTLHGKNTLLNKSMRPFVIGLALVSRCGQKWRHATFEKKLQEICIVSVPFLYSTFPWKHHISDGVLYHAGLGIRGYPGADLHLTLNLDKSQHLTQGHWHKMWVRNQSSYISHWKSKVICKEPFCSKSCQIKSDTIIA